MIRAGHVVALCALALLTIGVVMVNSASLTVTGVAGPLAPAGTPVQASGMTLKTALFTSATVHMLVALGMMAVMAFIPIRRLVGGAGEALSDQHDVAKAWGGLAIGVIGMICVLGLVYVPGIGQAKNGSHRWINIPGLGEGLSAQPSEIAKWGMLLLIAWYCAVRGAQMKSFFKGLAPALVAIGAVAGFIILEDLGTGLLITVACCVLLLAGGARIWHFLMFVPIGVAGIVVAVVKSPYRLTRITTFLDPFKDPEGTGYHQVQSLIAIANGQGFGRGLGFGLQSKGYLPEDRTDFLFSIICEELGIPGAAAVVFLFVVLIWAGLSIVKNEKSAALKLFALGATVTIGVQAVINLAVVTVVAPTKGIALPLISAGGTGWILTAMSLGLLIAIDRTSDEAAEATGTFTLPLTQAGGSAAGSVAA
ncbi:MAG: FtsW/RodA/SpoVE family cell cycle protein [Phycisphaerales bacterium]|nr:FtsW/RodA/SpoVE family cell cycle protein [Planctomycetota bacterium]